MCPCKIQLWLRGFGYLSLLYFSDMILAEPPAVVKKMYELLGELKYTCVMQLLTGRSAAWPWKAGMAKCCA